jgi:hypothetical protein
MRHTLLVLTFVAAVIGASPATGESERLRSGLSAVVVRENMRFLDRWGECHEAQHGRPVKIVKRRANRDVMDIIENGVLDIAWIYGF